MELRTAAIGQDAAVAGRLEDDLEGERKRDEAANGFIDRAVVI
jgi:hypothetical protein